MFNTIVGETTKGGTVNMRFLRSVVVGSLIEEFDWCSYIITCLKRTKLKWSGTEHYNGPLYFLAKDAIECDEMPNNSITNENVVVPENVADENVVVPDNVCGEAHEDEAHEVYSEM
ncbi:hypothetical protein R6Q59_003071 [Mikania micrantha]